MGRGFLAGIFWGAIVGIGLFLVSLQTLDRRSLSLPQPEATEVEVPGGSEFDQARVEGDTVLPETDDSPASDAAELTEAPSDPGDEAPTFDTSALEVPTPSVGAAGELSDAPNATPAPEAPTVSEETRPVDTTVDLEVPVSPGDAPDTGDDAPSDAAGSSTDQDAEPTAPSTDEAPEESVVAALPSAEDDTSSGATLEAAPTVETDDTSPTAPQAPEVADEPSFPSIAEGDEEEPSLPWLEALEQPSEPAEPESVGTAPETLSDAPSLPQVTERGAASDENSFFQNVETLEDRAEGVKTDRLPAVGETPSEDAGTQDVASAEGSTGTLPTVRRLGQDNAVQDEETPEAEGAEVADGDLIDEGAPAIQRFGLEFENPESNPLIAVVLVHDGEASLSPTDLSVLPATVAIAVDAGSQDARNIALDYRAAGREVVMIPSLPDGATPQDVEQALRVNFETVPEAVAVMDVSGSSFQSDRSAVQQVVDVASDTGLGLITFPRGLNTAHQSAERAGVPAGLIFRRLDGASESGEQIRRTLDRAAFRARPDEPVILVGTTAPETLTAIVDWAAGNRARSVALAPVSAALQD